MHARFPAWFGRVLVLAEFIFGGWMIASAPHANGTQAWVLGIGIMALCFGVLTLALALPLWRSTKIYPTDLRIPSGLRSRKVISLSRIAGIGMLLRPSIPGTRSPMMWVTFIWDDHGNRSQIRSLNFTPLLVRASAGRSARDRPSITANPWDVDPFAITNTDVIGQSTAGRATADIYRRVVAIQGPHGPLLTQNRERHATYSVWDVPLYTAFWSPDGRYARFRKSDPPKREWEDDG